ncbi:MAG: hypothetical protein HAW62_03580 [Endozoicomonadaceae bacterium]|nr:hypothetical protein [Endozoicomonadaceae bacterium]
MIIKNLKWLLCALMLCFTSTLSFSFHPADFVLNWMFEEILHFNTKDNALAGKMLLKNIKNTPAFEKDYTFLVENEDQFLQTCRDQMHSFSPDFLIKHFILFSYEEKQKLQSFILKKQVLTCFFKTEHIDKVDIDRFLNHLHYASSDDEHLSVLCLDENLKYRLSNYKTLVCNFQETILTKDLKTILAKRVAALELMQILLENTTTSHTPQYYKMNNLISQYIEHEDCRS